MLPAHPSFLRRGRCVPSGSSVALKSPRPWSPGWPVRSRRRCRGNTPPACPAGRRQCAGEATDHHQARVRQEHGGVAETRVAHRAQLGPGVFGRVIDLDAVERAQPAVLPAADQHAPVWEQRGGVTAARGVQARSRRPSLVGPGRRSPPRRPPHPPPHPRSARARPAGV